MKRGISFLFSAVAVAGVLACGDSASPAGEEAPELSPAFASLPIGFPMVHHTFGETADSIGEGWTPGESNRLDDSLGRGPNRGPGRGGPRSGGPGRDGPRDGQRPDDFGAPGEGRGMMCGGLGGPFGGFGFDLGFGRGMFGGALPGTCAFDAALGRVLCRPVERGGLTIVRSAAYADANGQVQEAFDRLTTNSINIQVGVTGTRTRRDGATSTIRHQSDRTVAGLAEGSTERVVDGTSAGLETTTGTNETGDFTAERLVGDTIRSVTIPVRTAGQPPYPTLGQIIRSMQVTLTYAGQDPVVSTRREVITFDGSNMATVEITRNGVTKTCQLPLPHGRLICD